EAIRRGETDRADSEGAARSGRHAAIRAADDAVRGLPRAGAVRRGSDRLAVRDAGRHVEAARNSGAAAPGASARRAADHDRARGVSGTSPPGGERESGRLTTAAPRRQPDVVRGLGALLRGADASAGLLPRTGEPPLPVEGAAVSRLPDRARRGTPDRR